jgi:hypothetical protein
MFERGTIYDILGDLVVYRNLEPADGRLRRPQLLPLFPPQSWGGGRGGIPRKAEPAYARAILHLLDQAQALRSDRPLQRLIYIGDTAMNDGQAIRNLSQHLPTYGFIGHERGEEVKRIEVTPLHPSYWGGNGGIMLANRWTALADFIHFLQGQGFAFDEATVALIDLDKTAFGARGRNSQVIDAARVEAVRRTVEEVLGGDFDEEEFRAVYDELNQPRYHPFTADNQDYLAYICLMVSGGVYDFAQLLADLEAERLSSFAQFIEACAERTIGEELIPVHQEVYANFRRGDPTPFKSFRYREYEETVRRMDHLPDDADEERVLAEEIVITREVADVCRFLRGKGVLLFGLTDKPDESSIPPLELAQKGYLPLHRVTMKVIGDSIDSLIN